MLVYFWAFVLASVTIAYLFVCVDSNKPGILATIKVFLFQTLPTLVKDLA